MTTFGDMVREYGGAPVGMSILQPSTVKWVYGTKGSNIEDAISERVKGNELYSSLSDAHSDCTTNRNDTVFVTPETHTLSSALTWSKSNTNMIGMYHGSPWANDVIVQQTGSTAQSPAVTISGSDNLIANIHFKMDGSSADQHIMVKNTGSGNHYKNCWFEGPTNATQADDSDVEMVQVDGGGNYFENCVFGTTASASGGATLLGFTGSAYRSTFKDCIFYQQVDNVAARFIECSTSMDISGPQFFKDCIFHAWWSEQSDKATYLINGGTGTPTGEMHFNGCSVVGFDDVITDTAEQAIFFDNQLTGAPDGTYSGLVVNVTKS